MRVTRRTAIKTIAAVLTAPCVVLRNEIDREAILSQFCYDGRARYDMDRPFSVGSLTYATDAKWLVRAELALPKIDGERCIPPVERAWKEYWQPVSGFSEFTLPHWTDNRCKPCRVYCGQCPECGDRRVSYGNEYPPNELLDSRWVSDVQYDIDDNTIRDISCYVCKGKKWLGNSEIQIHGIWHDYWRLKQIMSIPSVKIATTKEAILFMADGFEGISMGLMP